MAAFVDCSIGNVRLVRRYWSGCTDTCGLLLFWHQTCTQTRCTDNGSGRALTPLCVRRRPHHFWYKRPWFAIDEHHRRQDGPICPVGRGSVDKIAVHHYVTKCDVRAILLWPRKILLPQHPAS